MPSLGRSAHRVGEGGQRPGRRRPTGTFAADRTLGRHRPPRVGSCNLSSKPKEALMRLALAAPAALSLASCSTNDTAKTADTAPADTPGAPAVAAASPAAPAPDSPA